MAVDDFYTKLRSEAETPEVTETPEVKEADFYTKLRSEAEASKVEEVDFYTKLKSEAEASLKPVGIRETLKRVDVIDVLEHIPVPFNPYQGAEKRGYLEAKEKLADPVSAFEGRPSSDVMIKLKSGESIRAADLFKQAAQKTVKRFEDWEQEKAIRGTTWGQSVTHGILDILPWVADIAISGGMRKSVTLALSKAIKSKKLATSAALLANAAVASAMQPFRLSETVSTIKIEDPELPKSKVYEKAVMRLYIENLSEMTGQYITKGAVKYGTPILKKLPFGGKLVEKVGAGWRKMFTKSNEELLEKISTATGINDLFGEYGEERVNTILQALVDADDFGAGKDAGPFERIYAGLKQDVANIGVEIPILTFPAGGRYVVAKVLGVPTKAVKDRPKENDFVKFEGTQKGVPAEGIKDFDLYTLKVDIPGHPAGSTVSERSVRKAGIPLPGDVAEVAEPVEAARRLTTKQFIDRLRSESGRVLTEAEIKGIERKSYLREVTGESSLKALDGDQLIKLKGTLEAQFDTAFDLTPVAELPETVASNIVAKYRPDIQRAQLEGDEQVLIELKAARQSEIDKLDLSPEGRRLIQVEFADDVIGAITGIAEPTPAVEPPVVEEKAVELTKLFTDWLIQRPVDIRAAINEYIESENIDNAIEAYQKVTEGPYRSKSIVRKQVLKAVEAAKRHPHWPIKLGKHLDQAEVARLQAKFEKLLRAKKEVREKIGDEPERLTRKKALKLGHSIPEILGWTEDQRRNFMKETVGVESMKNIPDNKKGKKLFKTLIHALYEELEQRDLIYKEPVSLTNELVETLDQLPEKPSSPELNRKPMAKLWDSIKIGVHQFGISLVRLERFFEGLDGGKEGVFYKTFWKLVNDASNLVDGLVNQQQGLFYDELERRGIDTVLWMGVVEDVPGTKHRLTKSQKIGVYCLSENENGMRYLVKGMNFSVEDVTTIKEQMSDQETQMAEWLLDEYEAQWATLQVAAAQAGIDLATLKKEFKYSPIIRTDMSLEQQEDFLSELAEGFYAEELAPEKGMLNVRKKGAIGKVELDAFIVYSHNLARVERFKEFAPLANKLGKILNNRDFKRALNEKTHGKGSRLINKWLKDSIKGSSTDTTTWFGRAMAILRRNSIVYAIGYNIPSSLRQTISGMLAMAVDPRMAYVMPANIARALDPRQYKKMEVFVYDRAPEFKHRSMDRDIRRAWNKVSLKRNLTFTEWKKRYAKVFGHAGGALGNVGDAAAMKTDLNKLYLYYKSGKPFSQSALRLIKATDRWTVILSWKSLYDVAIIKGMNDKEASEYAIKHTSRTQPMGNIQHLPDFFRGGTLEKILSTFNNYVNQLANFYYHDIFQVGKKGAEAAWHGDLTTLQIAKETGTLGYRVMFSYILPAIMFGMIGRGGLPKDWKQLGVDMATYPLFTLMLFGRLIDRMIRGWGGSTSIVETAPEAAVAVGRAAGRGDWQEVIKKAATVVAATKGVPPTAQMIRTVEGIGDIATGKDQRARRIIWSKWALDQGKRPEPTTGRRVRRRVRPRKRTRVRTVE